MNKPNHLNLGARVPQVSFRTRNCEKTVEELSRQHALVRICQAIWPCLEN